MTRYIIFLVCLAFFSCQEPYIPKYEIEDAKSIFIVEGFINIDGNSEFKLSQTVPVQAETTQNPVSNASFEIIGSNGYTFKQSLTSNTGSFRLNHTNLPLSQKYKIKINALNNTYESEFVEPLLTSPITHIDTLRTEEGLEFKVSTNNDNSENKFYRWEFEEDWKFSAKFISFLIFDNPEVRRREENEGISFCYSNQKSSNILIASTETFDANKVDKKYIHLIPNNSEKLQYRYSILVKQFNISKEAYMYWDILRKNSEAVGDIFGSMPSELKGNIKNINNATEPVIGMIQVAKPSEKRIYLNNTTLKPIWIAKIPFYDQCVSSEILTRDAATFFRSNSNFIPIHDVYANPESAYPTHYAYTSKACTDCSVRGRRQAPDFWTE